MNKVQEALKAAINALEYTQTNSNFNYDRTLRLCKTAQAEIGKCYGETTPVSGPVAYLVDGRCEQGLFFDKASANIMAEANCGTVRELYTSPISKEWVGLTYKDKVDLRENTDWYNFPNDLIEATEAKLKQLNTPEKG